MSNLRRRQKLERASEIAVFAYQRCPTRLVPTLHLLFGEGGGQLDRRQVRGGLNSCARESKVRTGRFLREKLMSDHGHFSSYEGHKERRTGKIRGVFRGCTGFWTAGCWLARRFHQLKASTTMGLGISVFLNFVRCVAWRNLDLLIKTGWSVICPLCC